MLDFRALSTMEIALIAATVLLVVVCIVLYGDQKRRRTARLRTQFGGVEYARTVKIDGDQGHAEAALEGRTRRVEGLHVRPLTVADRTLYLASWRDVQARFVDSPAGAVAEADHLLRDVMSARGYPLSDFEQRADDLSVGHPVGLEDYRTAHAIAVRETQGKATTEELRQAMVYYRRLFEELAGEPPVSVAKAGD